MIRQTGGSVLLFGLGVALLTPASVPAQQVAIIERPCDPHGTPRPARGARDVPLATSLYFELGMGPAAQAEAVSTDSVTVQLEPERGAPRPLLGPGQQFAGRSSGWLRPRRVQQGAALRTVSLLAVYIEPGEPLQPATTYTVRVAARTGGGAAHVDAAGTWSFTTEAAPRAHSLPLALDLGAAPVQWHGAFFSGLCNVCFCTQAASFGPTYDLMAAARKEHPRAWSYQRDFWMTGSDHRKPGLFDFHLPNIVRERETRRIAAIQERPDGLVLRLEDFFGHDQYGTPTGRPLSGDYHAGDEVLVADGIHAESAKVVAVDDEGRTVVISAVPSPPGGWKIDYEGPLPQREDPDAPGLFPPGGCYLRKLRPHGTACFYWGRLDKEWDLVHARHGRRLLVNFADAPGDLARDGRSWTTVKDYAQWHDVARTLAGHVIDRYGPDALQFTWSIFNEPDLGALFWRTSWDELQRYYDYTTDAILRAFEDRGLDSDQVRIGGLELGAIFGTHLKLQEFLAHCSPRATANGALGPNAAFADPRLDGKRSRRVETLCRAHAGKGAPCDFVSIHAYNRSEVMAAKLIRAKEIALEIDPDYYRDLWVNSHESCPDWNLPPDEAAADSYLGNGYFPTWCVDVARRQLARAAADPRFGSGETLLTVWPPPRNFAGMNAITRIIHCDDDGDGRTDRQITIPMPIFHVLGLLSDMGDHYHVLREQQVGGHVVAGFASRSQEGDTVRILLYSHHAADTQSRSDASFAVTLDLSGLGWQGPARVQEYRFDRDHNTYFRQARELRDPPPATAEALFAPPRAYPRATVERIQVLAECRPTASASYPIAPDGRLRLTAEVAGNGVNFLVIEPERRCSNSDCTDLLHSPRRAMTAGGQESGLHADLLQSECASTATRNSPEARTSASLGRAASRPIGSRGM
jgi:hypothetical protein